MVIGGRQSVPAGRCPTLLLAHVPSSYPCCRGCDYQDLEGRLAISSNSFLSPIASAATGSHCKCALRERPLWPFSPSLLPPLLALLSSCLLALSRSSASAVLVRLLFSTRSTSRGCFPPATVAAVASTASAASSSPTSLPLESNCVGGGPCLKSRKLAGESKALSRHYYYSRLQLLLEACSCGLVQTDEEAGFSGGYGFSLFNLDELGSHSFVDCSFDSSNKTKVAASVNLIVS